MGRRTPPSRRPKCIGGKAGDSAGGGQPIRRAGLGLAVAVGSALLLVGCGQPAVTNVPGQPSSTAPAASAEASSACALVPDMDTIVGKVAIVAPAEYQTGSLSRCTWVYATNPTRHVGAQLRTGERPYRLDHELRTG